MAQTSLVHPLVRIPVHAVGPDYPMETLEREETRAHALIDDATGELPPAALRVLDTISRRWLAKQDSGYLPEIDAIARRLARPGAYFLSVNYEWGCSCKVGRSPDQKSARLVRVLDWLTPGLGRELVAALVAGAAGPFTTLTWPGYTGLLQAMAPQRFSAALNQAPMRAPLGSFHLDWAVNRTRVWRMTYQTPAHLLREVFETAGSFAEAKRMLAEQPVSRRRSSRLPVSSRRRRPSSRRRKRACTRAATQRPTIGKRRAGAGISAAAKAPSAPAGCMRSRPRSTGISPGSCRRSSTATRAL